MNGADARLGIGQQWNHIEVASRPDVSSDPQIDKLRNGVGAVTDVRFSILGKVSSLHQGADRLVSDSIFVGALGADASVGADRRIGDRVAQAQ